LLEPAANRALLNRDLSRFVLRQDLGLPSLSFVVAVSARGELVEPAAFSVRRCRAFFFPQASYPEIELVSVGTLR
jgi:hypothetical protein